LVFLAALGLARSNSRRRGEKATMDDGRDAAGGASKRPDFTGVWKQFKHENADKYLCAMGYNFATRAVMARFMGQSTEVVSHDGEMVHLNSINRRGEWTRTYVESEREVPMELADGQSVRTTTWWEDDESLGVPVHKTRVVGAKQGVLETWRWIASPGASGGNAEKRSMVVKSIVYPEGKEDEAEHMLWHFGKAPSSSVARAAVGAREEAHPLLKKFCETYIESYVPPGRSDIRQADLAEAIERPWLLAMPK